ncbi:MAG TPA: hypothetical protein VJ936_05120, partial [Desulfobacteraceae bacterium]|nr:hypothetical protein [Desulfobacteraceae bacterium]
TGNRLTQAEFGRAFPPGCCDAEHHGCCINLYAALFSVNLNINLVSKTWHHRSKKLETGFNQLFRVCFVLEGI